MMVSGMDAAFNPRPITAGVRRTAIMGRGSHISSPGGWFYPG